MDYKSLQKQHLSLMTGVWFTDLANTCAFLMWEFPRINWVGFYLLKGEKLYLGPFQGKPACTEIPLNRGVCGKAARLKEVVVVPDVHQFPDHIVCDSASRSEMVIPLLIDKELIGVLDIDSAETDRFDIEAQRFFIEISKNLISISKNIPKIF